MVQTPSSCSSLEADTRTPLLRSSIGDRLTETASEHGSCDALAWIPPNSTALQHMSWTELHSRARAQALDFLDVTESGCRIALIAPNSAAWVVAMYAAALAGTPLVPIGPNSTEPEIAHIVSDCSVRAIVTTADLAQSSPVAAPGLPTLVLVDCEIPLPDSPSPDLAPRATLPSVAPTSEFLVQYTSGTTGKPKGASLTHLAALNSAHFYGRRILPGEREILFNPLPLHHVGGSVAGALTTLATHACFLIVPRFVPADALALIRGSGATALGLVPTMLIDMLALPGASVDDFDSVHTVVGGATAIDSALVQNVQSRFGIRFMVGYGQSEAPASIMSSVDDGPEDVASSLGHPMPHRAVRIVDENGATVPFDVPGELCISSPLNMSGYVHGAGLRSASDPEGWLHTGDLCSMNSRGLLAFHARLREMIVRGGANIYPAEVEATLRLHPAVDDVAVFGIPDARLGERVGAAVCVRDSVGVRDSATVDELRAFARTLLSSSKVPEKFWIVPEMPRTSTGKIRKHLLAERLRDDQ